MSLSPKGAADLKGIAGLPKSKIDYPTSDTRGVPRPFTAEGTYDSVACPAPQAKVTYYDGGGGDVGHQGPDPCHLIDDTSWDFGCTPPAGAVTCKIETFCGGVVQDTADPVYLV